ncbi:MAG: DM13 domain-containing protein [Cyclobacteriaceae bacterium]|nr:DM13 domain-containing protein [Cyclobacteriaceae bacterium]
MKKNIILLFITAMISCKEDDATPTAPINDSFDPTTATLLKSGSLAGIGHTVSGTASLYEGTAKKIILLDPFNSQNGPDLKVYLSKDINASSYISLGALKSTMGKQSYEVPGNPDVTDYNYVMIWCEQFTVVFGRAEIK